MSEALVSIDVSEVREGKLDALKPAMQDLVKFVDANEPQPIAYHVYLNEHDSRMTVFQIHPDSASMEYHMEVAGSAFAKLSDFLTLSRIDIYGIPSRRLLEQLRAKGQMLGNAVVAVHELHAGFTRLEAR
jgi:hypothetical protein